MFMLAFVFSVVSLSGYEIMSNTYNRPLPESSKSTVKMVIKKGGDERVRKIQSYTKREGDIRKTLIRFLEPADVRGAGFLQIENEKEKGETEQFLYLTSLKRTRRIASSDKASSFMGSELTYEDMERKKPDDYENKLIEETENTYIVESTPKPGKETQYSKIKSWVRKDFFIVKTEIYDKDKKLLKVVEFKDIEPIDGFLTARNVIVKNVQNGNITIMQIQEIDNKADIKSNIFTKQYLERGF